MSKSPSEPPPVPPPDRERVRRLVAEVVGRVVGETPAAQAPGSAGAPPAAPAPAARPAEAAPGKPADAHPAKPAVALGGDHGALALKNQLARFLQEELGYRVIDCGTNSEEPVDYPDIARDVARAVAAGNAWRGIVLDAMGVGSTMAANKVRGVRCALCHDEATTRNAREHNDANVLALGSRVVNPGLARALVRLFLATAHAGGRHARRVAKIQALEQLPAGPAPARGPE
jgi:ribose 5-phosphate isomerase B